MTNLSDMLSMRTRAEEPPLAPPRATAYMGSPLAVGHCGRRFVRPLYLPIRGTDRHQEMVVLWWREASPEALTRECREIGVSAALSWLASHCERMNAAYLVACEILCRPVHAAMLPPGETFTHDIDGEPLP
jgi:hypothetical protein